MDRYKNKLHNQRKGQCNPNLNKKGDMDRKEKENKIRRARKGKDPYGLVDLPRFPLRSLTN